MAGPRRMRTRGAEPICLAKPSPYQPTLWAEAAESGRSLGMVTGTGGGLMD